MFSNTKVSTGNLPQELSHSFLNTGETGEVKLQEVSFLAGLLLEVRDSFVGFALIASGQVDGRVLLQ